MGYTLNRDKLKQKMQYMVHQSETPGSVIYRGFHFGSVVPILSVEPFADVVVETVSVNALSLRIAYSAA